MQRCDPKPPPHDPKPPPQRCDPKPPPNHPKPPTTQASGRATSPAGSSTTTRFRRGCKATAPCWRWRRGAIGSSLAGADCADSVRTFALAVRWRRRIMQREPQMSTTTGTSEPARQAERRFCVGGSPRRAHRPERPPPPGGEQAVNQQPSLRAARIKIPIPHVRGTNPKDPSHYAALVKTPC